MNERLRVLEQALIVEMKLSEVVLAYQGEINMNLAMSPDPEVVNRNRELQIRVSNAMVGMGPLKRLQLPPHQKRAEDIRKGKFLSTSFFLIFHSGSFADLGLLC